MAALVLACGRPPADNPNGIEIHSASETLTAGGKPVTLSATVPNGGEGITWSLSGPGSLSAASGASIVYFPPTCVVSPTQALVTAASGASSATLALGITPAAVKVSCIEVIASSGETTIGDPAVTLTASVTGDASGVRWTVFGGGTLSAATGPTTQYTPLPNPSFDTAVTITASLGDLSAHAGILVHPRPRYRIEGCPVSLAFDGSSLWVANGGVWPTQQGSLMKIRPEDGTILASIPVAKPGNLLFDGTNIWASSRIDHSYWEASDLTFVKVRASDAAVLGTFNVWYASNEVQSGASNALAFDGENIWAVVYDAVAKIRASDGTRLAVFPALGASAVAWDGRSAWFVAGGLLTQLSPEAAVEARILLPQGTRQMMMVGNTLWLALSPSIVQIDPRSRIVMDSRTPKDGFAIGGMWAFDGTSLWTGGGPIRKLDPSDLSLQAKYTLPADPTALTFGAGHTWVATCGSADNNAIFKL
jgi:hypothetical protein